MKLHGWQFRLGLVVAIGFLSQVLGARDAFAGAWNKPQWGYFLQLSASFTDTTDRWTGSGNSTRIQVTPNFNANNPDPRAPGIGAPNPSRFLQLMSDLYFELGLLRHLTVFGDIGYVSSVQSNEGGNIKYSAHGIADLMFGARVSILEKPVALALEGRLFIPTGDSTAIIPLGTGDFRGELRLALGKAWSDLKVPIYFDAEVGVMLRGTGTVRDPSGVIAPYQKGVSYAPEVVVHGEIGATLYKQPNQDRLLLVAGLDYRGSTSRSEPGAFVLTPTTQEYTSVSGMLMGFIWRGIGLSLRYAYNVEGRNTLKTGTVSGGVFASF